MKICGKPIRENWLSYSGSYHAQRHSLLNQIHTGNVSDLVAAVGVSHSRRQPAGERAGCGRRRDVRVAAERSLCARRPQRQA